MEPSEYWEIIARDGYFREHWAYLALTKEHPQGPPVPQLDVEGAHDVLRFLEQANLYAQDQYAREAQQLGYVTGMHTMPFKEKPAAKKLNTEQQGVIPMPEETPQEPKPKKLVYALKYHTRDGEEHQPGDSYEVPEDALENLKAQGMVSEDPPKPPDEPQAV